MEMELKFKSVAFKWFSNVFLVIFIIVFVLEIAFCIFVNSYYNNRVQTGAEELAQVFITPLEHTDATNFEAVAREYCEQFEHKDRIEIQILNPKGKVLISTTGFAETPSQMPDFDKALQSGTVGNWSGKSSAGEQVVCQTTLIYDGSDNLNGAVRWMVSAASMQRRILVFCLIGIFIGISLLVIIVISGAYFINSIVRPIRNVSGVARKIAMGDFDTRIELKANNEIGELCDSINYMAGELKSAENMKNDFISSVSHELRTPLTAIRGWAETAKMSIGYDEDTVNKGLDVVIKESERLHSLVEALLDFSRMQSGHLPMSMAEFDPEAVLSEAADMYRELAKKQNVELIYMTASEQVACAGDTNRIKQVFINVIDNALKYNQPGGQILIEQKIEDGCIQISVSDTGVGISEKDIDRVKEKFYKANKQVRGSGIGLAVADEIIKQHNGLLLVDSTEGVGTTVTIVLPIIESPKEGETNEL